MTAAKVMDVMTRLPRCAGQAADAISKNPSQDGGHFNLSRYLKYFRPKSWSDIEEPLDPLERNLYGLPLARLLWKRQLEKSSFGTGNANFVHREQGLFPSVYVDDITMAGRKQSFNPMWEKWMKLVDLGEPTSFLDHLYWGCTPRECETERNYD